MGLIKITQLPPLDYLRTRFVVEADGTLRWLNGHKAGKAAGTRAKNNAPGSVKLDGRTYITSRIVFFMSTGIEPGESVIDHIDGNQNNNAPSNLRLATREQNGHNRRFKGKRIGARHVYWAARQNAWKVVVGHKWQQKFFGYFKDIEEAKQIAIQARAALYGDFKGSD